VVATVASDDLRVRIGMLALHRVVCGSTRDDGSGVVDAPNRGLLCPPILAPLQSASRAIGCTKAEETAQSRSPLTADRPARWQRSPGARRVRTAPTGPGGVCIECRSTQKQCTEPLHFTVSVCLSLAVRRPPVGTERAQDSRSLFSPSQARGAAC
jgi:hypothetical protein